MFQNEADLRAFASQVFIHFSSYDTPKGSRIPSPSTMSSSQYRFAYLAVFGIAPSDDEVELFALKLAGAQRSPIGDEDGEDGSVASRRMVSAPIRTIASQSDEERLLAAMERIKMVTTARLEKRFPLAPSAASSSGRSEVKCSRDDFLKRVVEKYTLLYGPFREQWQPEGHGAGGDPPTSATNSARLWALFDAISTDHKGFFTLKDVETAMSRLRARVNGVATVAEEHQQMLTFEERNYLKSVFIICDTDNDGRVTFEQYKDIYFGQHRA